MHPTDPLRQSPPPGPAAELEALLRLAVIRDALDLFLAGHWALDSEMLLLTAVILDQAGAWTMVAEDLGRAAA